MSDVFNELIYAMHVCHFTAYSLLKNIHIIYLHNFMGMMLIVNTLYYLIFDKY